MSKYNFIMVACAGLMAIACGKSSNDNNQPTLPVDQQTQTEAEALNNLCFNFPQNPACQNTQTPGSGDNGFGNGSGSGSGGNGGMGYVDYQYNPNQGQYGGTPAYGSVNYGGNQYANMCGCQHLGPGYQAVVLIVDGGSRMVCERISGTRTQGIEVAFTFSSDSRRHNNDPRVAVEVVGFDSTVIEQDFQSTSGNCQVTAPTRCIPGYANQCQGIPNGYGGGYMNAQCRPVYGQQYGECVQF